MAGVKGMKGGGGHRAGAGRKRVETVNAQANRRSVVLEVFDEDAWRDTVKAWLVLAAETPSVIYPLLPYILGGQKQEINISGQIDVVQMSTARRLLRVVGGTG